MFGIGFSEMILIFLVLLLLFGAKSIPEIAKGLGQAIRIFKSEIQTGNFLREDKDSPKPKDVAVGSPQEAGNGVAKKSWRDEILWETTPDEFAGKSFINPEK